MIINLATSMSASASNNNNDNKRLAWHHCRPHEFKEQGMYIYKRMSIHTPTFQGTHTNKPHRYPKTRQRHRRPHELKEAGPPCFFLRSVCVLSPTGPGCWTGASSAKISATLARAICNVVRDFCSYEISQWKYWGDIWESCNALRRKACINPS